MMLVALLIIAGFAFYVMTTEERWRALRPLGVLLRLGRIVAVLGEAVLRRFIIALLARNRWAFAGVTGVALFIFGVGMHARHLQSLTDVRPELQRLVTIEEKTSGTYDAAVVQFKLGAMSSDALSKVIRRRVMPELQGLRLRLKSLERVPTEHHRVLSQADDYLHLRFESWRLRAEALEKRSMTALKKADQAEVASRRAFERVRDADLP